MGGNDMDFSSFKRIINQFPHLIWLILQGFGEPFICKDFFKMVKYCKEKKIIVGTVTNGTLLNDATNKKIIDSGLDSIYISVDGANPDTFEYFRKGSNFDQVIENTRNLVHIRGKRKKPRIGFNFTGSKHNINELPLVLKLAKDTGVDELRAIEAYAFDYEEIENRIKDKELSKIPFEVQKSIDETILEARKLSIPFKWDGKRARTFNEKNKKNKSLHFLTYCYISYNGNITTCTFADPEKDSLGNILEQDFKEIWNNENYVSLRKAAYQNLYPPYCNKCTFWPT
jgi:radical SAM protein with 4Fe4S-binding SPASM domain